jgi:hypothetical protein
VGATIGICPSPARDRLGEGHLDAAALTAFGERGYHLLEGFLDESTCAGLRQEIDAMVAGLAAAHSPERQEQRSRWAFTWPLHRQLLVEPRLIAMLRQLMDGGFTFHHLHTARHDAGSDGVSWHHDYEQIPHTNRAHLMVHIFFYPNGLDGTIGDLLVLPGSHRAVMERGSLNACGTGALPGERVFDRLRPGSAVIVHSALQHARRRRAGGEGHPRYFIDASYCQAGTRWPGYPDFAPMLARARELGLAHPEVPELTDAARFFDRQEACERLAAINRGSLVERL